MKVSLSATIRANAPDSNFEQIKSAFRGAILKVIDNANFFNDGNFLIDFTCTSEAETKEDIEKFERENY